MANQLNDLWVSYLKSEGYTGKQYNDLTRRALQDQTGTARKQLDDLWFTYLKGEGYTGTVPGMMYKWLGDKGYAGNLNDRWKQAIEAGDVFATGGGLACPYTMDSQAVPSFGLQPFDSFNFTDGVATGTLTAGGSSKNGQMAQEEDYTRIQGGVSGEPMWQSIPSGSGKIVMEAELASLSDGASFHILAAYAGNIADSDYAEVRIRTGTTALTIGSQGIGSTLLSAEEITIPRNIQEGDRCLICVDTDTGAFDFITEEGHENFAETPLADVTGGSGFMMSTGINAATTDGVFKMHTKVSDMVLPAPAGATDTCGNTVNNELVTYSLNATEAAIQSFGFAGKLTDVVLAEQQGSFTIPDTAPASSERYLLVKDPSDPGFPLDFSTGKIAFEFEVDIEGFTPLNGALSSPLTSCVCEVTDSATLTRILGVSFLQSQDNQALLQVFGGPSTVTTIGKHRIGFLLDNDNDDLRIWLDGTEITPAEPLPVLTNCAIVLSAYNEPNDRNGGNGTTNDLRLITDPYWFTTTFPAGSQDINGNVFN